jgi:uncharacterized protein (TIGR00288 family)
VKDFSHLRSGRTSDAERLLNAPNAALMIDFDNVTMGIRSDLQAQLRRLLNSEIIKGKVAVQRAYADWRRYPQYIVPLSEASIDLIFAPAFGSNKKNATDIRLAIDALELVFTRPEIGTFILLSGDSDFSSLVLKLKEYGKYVIGVGLRESSSDLLIQNCDEYFSYTEVTGLTKEGDGESSRRDPWELVVEAVLQMKREDDVMRSDRLKQVMQSIDPSFDEKDAGYNRFSKFVVEAGRRGLLSIEKMDNGQYAIDVGDNANLPPEEEAELRKPSSGGAERSAKPRRRRGGGGRRKSEEDNGDHLTLSDAFDLLRKVLADAKDAADGVEAEQVHAAMVKSHGSESDPLFERRRFQRMLRQAHDANVVELAKVDGEYRLKPGVAKPAEEAEASGKGGAGETESTGDADGSAKRTRTRKSSRGRTRAARKKPDDEKTPQASKPPEPPVKQKTEAAKQAPDAKESGATRKRNPRFRRGTRGGTAARKDSSAPGTPLPGKVADGAAASQPAEPAAKSSGTTESPASESQGSGRSVSRGRSRGGRRPVQSPKKEDEGEQSAAAARTESKADASSENTAKPRTDTPAPPASPTQQPSLFDGGTAEDDSLFRRMSAALQRVMRGTEGE